MNLHAIPVIGTILSLCVTIFTAIPFWFVWTVLGIGEKFFYFLPELYLSIGFWETVGLFMVLSILKMFSPFNVSSSSSGNSN